MAGCAATSSGGDRLLAQGDYEQAISHYQGELARNPQSAHLWRNLGIAYFHLQRYDESLESFDQAEKFEPNHPQTVLYRGMVHEQRGEVSAAVALYRSYLSLSEDDQRLAPEVRYRLRWLEDRRLQELVASAIAGESEIDASSIPENTVAVVRFDASSLADQYKPLGRGIAELIYHDLSYVPDLTLVERLEIYHLQKELDLSQSELADQFNSPRVGKIVGASRVVTGKLEDLEQDELGIDAGIVAVGPELAKYPERRHGSISKVFELQKELTLEIIEQLGYELTPEIRNSINKSETESVLALIAYSRGLEYADRGMYQLAEAEFQAALREDPNFSLANQAARDYSGMSKFEGAPRPVTALAEMVAVEIDADAQSLVSQDDIIRRLQGSTEGAPPEDENPEVTPRPGTTTVRVTGRTD
jgi:tetratricopeptide (TPR) repeat protein